MVNIKNLENLNLELKNYTNIAMQAFSNITISNNIIKLLDSISLEIINIKKEFQLKDRNLVLEISGLEKLIVDFNSSNNIEKSGVLNNIEKSITRILFLIKNG